MQLPIANTENQRPSPVGRSWTPQPLQPGGAPNAQCHAYMQLWNQRRRAGPRGCGICPGTLLFELTSYDARRVAENPWHSLLRAQSGGALSAMYATVCSEEYLAGAPTPLQSLQHHVKFDHFLVWHNRLALIEGYWPLRPR